MIAWNGGSTGGITLPTVLRTSRTSVRSAVIASAMDRTAGRIIDRISGKIPSTEPKIGSMTGVIGDGESNHEPAAASRRLHGTHSNL